MDLQLRRTVLLVLQLCVASTAMLVNAQDTKTSATSGEWKSLRIINGEYDLVELALAQKGIPIAPRHPHFNQKIIGKRIAPQFIELKYPIDKELGLSETERQELISLYLELPAIERSLKEFLTKEYEKKRKIARDKLETADNRLKAGKASVKIHQDYMQRRASVVYGRLIEILDPSKVQRLNQLSRQLALRQGWNWPSLEGLTDHLVPSCLQFNPRQIAELNSIRESFRNSYTSSNVATIYPRFTAEGKPIPDWFGSVVVIEIECLVWLKVRIIRLIDFNPKQRWIIGSIWAGGQHGVVFGERCITKTPSLRGC
jgi:hypothetical protein